MENSRGRPAKPARKAQTERIGICVSPEEGDLLRELATKEGLPVGTWARIQLLSSGRAIILSESQLEILERVAKARGFDPATYARAMLLQSLRADNANIETLPR